jgi:RND superfamily putative drug exporter
LDSSLAVTLPLSFIILLIAFGAIAAAFVPLVLAITALLAAFGFLAIYSNTVTKVDPSASQLIVLIGLAVSVDYSLFVITRYRTERRRGRSKLAAIEIASSTAGRAVFFSGITVMISLCGLFFLPDATFTSMAAGTISVVLASVIGSLTFLPAFLAILGNGVNWGRIPFIGRDREEGSGIWGRLVGMVMRYPVAFVIITLVILVGLAVPVLHLKMGNNSIEGLPDNLDAVQAYHLLNDKWHQGTTLQLNVVITQADQAATKAAIDKFKTETITKVPALSNPSVKFNDKGSAAQVSFYMGGGRNDQVNLDAVTKIRQEIIPAYFGSLPGVQAYVSGNSAYTIDVVKVYTDTMPLVFGFVLGMSFLLLLIAFHSLIIPIKAIILNLLSTSASYGAMVLVFQDGYLSQQIGFKPTGVIEAFVPIFVFTILFGLSMDYHLFILTRIKEIKDLGATSNEAVAKGISSTSGTITSAAAIMVGVFAVFITLPIIIVRQLGLGLAVAVLLDASIIRSILLPATMRLLGDWNWWIPKFLDWIPHITIEGGPEEAEPLAMAEASVVEA